MYYLKVVIFAVCLALPAVFAFPDGAPTAACTTLVPLHGNQLNFELPLELMLSSQTLNSGSMLYLGLRSLNGTMFGDFQYRGFMVQARIQDGTNRVVGFFETSPGVRHVICPTLYPESTVTHTAHHDRSFVQVNWRAPANVGANNIVVRFYYTIVMNVGLFWANVVSPPVTILAH